MKNVTDLLAIVNDICPSIKASESLFIVDLIITERDRAYREGAIAMSPDYSAIKDEYDSEEAQERIEEKEHYGDYSDQRERE